MLLQSYSLVNLRCLRWPRHFRRISWRPKTLGQPAFLVALEGLLLNHFVPKFSFTDAFFSRWVTATTTESGAMDGFYNDLPRSEASAWTSKLLKQSVLPFTTLVAHIAWTAPKFTTRTSYIMWERHRDTLGSAEVFRGYRGIEHVASLSSRYSPFLSMPEKLAEVLVMQVENLGCSRASEVML